MAFGSPNRAGAFYAKRGIVHSALVVHVGANSFVTLDSGSGLGVRNQIPAQSIWLRPRAGMFNPQDAKELVKWSKLYASQSYDNFLIDDWKKFRQTLDAKLDTGLSQRSAVKQAFDISKSEGFAPGGYEGSFSFLPPSGIYCSEGVSAIFAYLGFRQYGDTPIDLVTAFSEKGELPEWDVYLSALEGFSANEGAALYMHQTFWNYFKIFEFARKMKLIQIPGYPDPAAGTFAQAIAANLKATEADAGQSDHIQKQMQTIVAALEGSPEQKELLASAKAVQDALARTAAGLSQARKRTINATQAAYSTFKENTAYGPHTFLENQKYFELKGVFYNTDLSEEGLGQAPWVADMSQQDGFVVEEGKKLPYYKYSNISTTLYKVDANNTALPKDRCEIGEAKAVLSTGPADWLQGPEFDF